MASDLSATLLIQFARAPVPGQVKTRMLPALSAEQACELHRDLVWWTCRRLVGANLGPVELAVAGGTGHPLFGQCVEAGASALVAQKGDDLGERMYCALDGGLARYPAVVLVGSDCPGIDRDYLQRAREALQCSPVVLGPAHDGGYVLIGVRRLERRLFEGIPWGSSRVLEVTRRRLREVNLDWVELETLTDIDRPEDLGVWEALRGQCAAGETSPGE